jgi:hypothetical protein
MVALVAPTHIVEGLGLFDREGCVVEFEVGDGASHIICSIKK